MTVRGRGKSNVTRVQRCRGILPDLMENPDSSYALELFHSALTKGMVELCYGSGIREVTEPLKTDRGRVPSVTRLLELAAKNDLLDEGCKDRLQKTVCHIDPIRHGRQRDYKLTEQDIQDLWTICVKIGIQCARPPVRSAQMRWVDEHAKQMQAVLEELEAAHGLIHELDWAAMQGEALKDGLSFQDRTRINSDIARLEMEYERLLVE